MHKNYNHKITLQDLAAHLGTTSASVSRALNDHPRISSELKSRVTKAAEELGYRQNRIASSLRKGKSFVIGILIPSAEISFFGSIVHGIDEVANQNGYSILLIQTGESATQEKKGIDTLMDLKVDGILASLTIETKDYSHFQKAMDSGIPIVLFDRIGQESLDIPAIVNDDFYGAYQATKHLLDQGYKQIVHAGGPQYLPVFENRYQGYKQALSDAGISITKSCFQEGNISIESGEKAIQYWVENNIPFDAVFAVEDYTALGCLNQLKSLHKKIPEEIGVIGFANELFGKYLTPSLSTVDQQTQLMGEEAMNLLLDIFHKNKEMTTRKKVVSVKPIFRQSSSRNI